MPIAIANVELINSFDQWRITTNQIIDSLKNDVVLKESLNIDSLAPFPELIQATSLDSVEVAAQPITSSPVTTVALLDISKINNFKVGQKVRIYGASANVSIMGAPPQPLIGKTGFTQLPPAGQQFSTFTYRIAQFDYDTGKVSPVTQVDAFNTLIRADNININNFNDINNISVTVTRTSSTAGVLVYRNIVGQINTPGYSLVAVLGPKELVGTTSTWIDYYNYDYVPWSKKNARNEFIDTSGLIHFPVNASSLINASKHGWVDTEITFVDNVSNRLTFAREFYFEPTCIVSHNDTAVLQEAIDTRYAAGAKSLELATKKYFVEGLIIPNDFSLLGKGSKTTLRKLSWSSNYINTGNKLLESAGSINDFNLTNIVLDGNMQNQYMLSETNDPSSNYLVDVKGNTSRYENVKLFNSIGGGIKANDSTSISVVSSFFLDSNLDDRGSYSPLDVGSSSDVVITSNIFKNFSGAVEASIVSTGSILGNVVKNCGSGLSVFGSTNLVSSPNVLMGPANEFLPTPDILNSAYDSVNIILEPSTNFNSDFYIYQENGSTVDLSPAGTNRTSIYHRVDKLQKIETVESIYGDEVLIAGNRPIQPAAGTNFSQGQFRFSISAQNVDVLLNSYSYSTLKALNANHVGLVYRSIATEYVPSGNVFSVIGYTNINRPIVANTAGVNNAADTINVTNAFLNPDTTPNTYFRVGDQVLYDVPVGNTAIGGLTAGATYYVTFANATSIAVSATYNGPNVNINELRVTNPGESHSLKKTLYQVQLTSNTTNIAIGSRVRFLDHQGTPNLDELIGTVTDYSDTTKICTIAYDPTINISANGVVGGAITVENSFVLAKGRIL